MNVRRGEAAPGDWSAPVLRGPALAPAATRPTTNGEEALTSGIRMFQASYHQVHRDGAGTPLRPGRLPKRYTSSRPACETGRSRFWARHHQTHTHDDALRSQP